MDKNLKDKKSLYERSPFLEQSMLMPLIPDPRPFEAKSSVEQVYFHSVEYVESLPSPRVIKTDNRITPNKQLYLKLRPRQGNRVTLLFSWHNCNAKVGPGEEEMLT